MPVEICDFAFNPRRLRSRAATYQVVRTSQVARSVRRGMDFQRNPSVSNTAVETFSAASGFSGINAEPIPYTNGRNRRATSGNNGPPGASERLRRKSHIVVV